MKHSLIALMLAAVFLLSMAGCSVTGKRGLEENPAEEIEENLEEAERKIRQKIRTMTEPVSEDPITKEEAQRIALEQLGLVEDQVRRLRTDYEISNGISQYDVEFQYGDWEYKFEIHAATGKILDFEKDHKSD